MTKRKAQSSSKQSEEIARNKLKEEELERKIKAEKSAREESEKAKKEEFELGIAAEKAALEESDKIKKDNHYSEAFQRFYMAGMLGYKEAWPKYRALGREIYFAKAEACIKGENAYGHEFEPRNLLALTHYRMAKKFGHPDAQKKIEELTKAAQQKVESAMKTHTDVAVTADMLKKGDSLQQELLKIVTPAAAPAKPDFAMVEFRNMPLVYMEEYGKYWVDKTKTQKDSESLFKAGEFFDKAPRAFQDLGQAIHFYGEAASQEDDRIPDHYTILAQFNLAQCYEKRARFHKALGEHQEAEENMKNAFEFYGEAAGNGDGAAKFELARFYYLGLAGVKINNKKAERLVAASQAGSDAESESEIETESGTKTEPETEYDKMERTTKRQKTGSEKDEDASSQSPVRESAAGEKVSGKVKKPKAAQLKQDLKKERETEF